MFKLFIKKEINVLISFFYFIILENIYKLMSHVTLEEIQNGKIFLIDKPLDYTSFAVVKKIKYKLSKFLKVKKIKIGHAGTLDPKATGLLVLVTGKFTKKITELQETKKTYVGTIKIGSQTPSYDTETEEINHQEYLHITDSQIQETVNQFIGKIKQIPPMYSAIKKDGVRMFDLARKGVEIELNEREVTIYDFKINSIKLPFLTFEVECSKGTYIRTLAKDFGNALGCGAYLTELRRTRSGEHSVDEALKIEEFIEQYKVIKSE